MSDQDGCKITATNISRRCIDAIRKEATSLGINDSDAAAVKWAVANAVAAGLHKKKGKKRAKRSRR